MLEVKRLRLAREWNQTELAFHAGLAPSVISEIENGKRDPSARTLRKLAEALEVDVADLFPKAQAPLPEFEDERRSPEAFEQALVRILEPARKEALREQQAATRVHASGGIPQSHIGDLPEAEAARRFVGELSPEERPVAFGEIAVGYARLERRVAQLEEENARLREVRRKEAAVSDEREEIAAFDERPASVE